MANVNRWRSFRLRLPANDAPLPPVPEPMLSRLMLATMILTVVIGLPLDRFCGIAGQLGVSFWTWGLFLLLLGRINQELRAPLMICLVVSTLGEFCLSIFWGVYVYWLHNVPLFVPPGHVLLFALGLTFAPRLPHRAIFLVGALAAGYGTFAFVTSTDTFSIIMTVLFLIFMLFGTNRRLYATMFVISLLMELYGTWIGNWTWVPDVPWLPLTSANPPLCVGGLYCALDLCVVNADRVLRKWRREADTILQAGSAA